jgi:hypothetical protein
MQKFSRLSLILAALILFIPGMVIADAPIPSGDSLPHDIIITEVQTENDTGSEEFVELYNNSDVDLDFSSVATNTWNLQYFSSTKVKSSTFEWSTTAPTGTLRLTGIIAARGYYIFASTPTSGAYNPGSIVPNQSFAGSHFADDGGAQLISVNSASGTAITTIHDHVGWLSEGSLVSGFYRTPAAKGSIQRLVGDDGGYIDTEENLNVFVGSEFITPGESWQAPADTTEEPEPPTDHEDDDESTDTASNDTPVTIPANLQALQLSELFPNPAAPQTDSDDEFVEIYNPNDEAIDLQGYTVQTGSSFAYSYVIKDGSIAGHAYTVFTSHSTNLSLANSGGQARLINPEGNVISESTAYENAAEGESWALINGVWQWTASPTPGAENNLMIPAEPTTKPKKASAKPAAKTAASKTTNPRTSSAKAASTKKQTPVPAEDGFSDSELPPPVHPAVLAGGGLSALVYAGYEYHADVINKIYKFRRYRAARRTARA